MLFVDNNLKVIMNGVHELAWVLLPGNLSGGMYIPARFSCAASSLFVFGGFVSCGET